MHTTTLAFGKHPESGYRLQAEMFVGLPREQVFNFFADARELERITPEWLNFAILTPLPVEMRQGLLLNYRIKLHHIPIHWTTEICVWEPSVRFVDQQIKGPYKRWYHEHTFEEVEGGTLVRDEVHYIPRGGSLIHRWMVRPDLEKIFKFRQDTLQEIFDEMIAKRTPVSMPQASTSV
ncbi:MAG: SRPBCC family protein [Mariniblastus sp.]